MNGVQNLLEERYFKPGEKTWYDLVNRVAEFLVPDDGEAQLMLRNEMLTKVFIPSSPVLMNSGSLQPMLCSCFVLPVADSIQAIMQSLTDTVMIQKYGGGVGLNFSPIRPEGSLVSTTGGRASGPVSFAGFWNEAMEVIRQGGKRQGAMMGVLDVDHPDLPLFLAAKTEEGRLTNFNLSVGLTAEFMADLYAGGEKLWPHGWTTKGTLRMIAQQAWKNGEPGVLFLDNINAENPYGIPIEATNPCGEVPLPPYGACCLGSLNLKRILTWRDSTQRWEMSWGMLRIYTRNAIRWLNAVLDATWWPVEEVAEFEQEHRPLGLGVMGLADALALMGIPYASARGRDMARDIMRTIREAAEEEADRIAKVTGVRNKTLLSIAPTGSISMMAEVNNSIEPFFTFAGSKKVEMGEFPIETRILGEVAKAFGYTFTDRDKQLIVETRGIQDTHAPKDMRELLRTATEMHWQDHVLMQEAVQHYVDNAVSKTNNIPGWETRETVEDIIITAHRLGLKGLTVYRQGSRDLEVYDCPTGTCEL